MFHPPQEGIFWNMAVLEVYGFQVILLLFFKGFDLLIFFFYRFLHTVLAKLVFFTRTLDCSHLLQECCIHLLTRGEPPLKALRFWTNKDKFTSLYLCNLKQYVSLIYVLKNRQLCELWKDDRPGNMLSTQSRPF